MSNYHTSVLLHETIKALQIKKGEQYIDATVGGGGHTELIVASGGNVLGIDQDQDALAEVAKRFIEDKHVLLTKGNFRDIDRITREHGIEKVAGIVFDLGISSHHVDDATRGFSFNKTGPLDMRMDQTLEVSAADLVNGLTRQELYELFTKLGEERFSKSIVQAISKARESKKIETTTELTEIIAKAVPFKQKGISPATRVFQALRIAVNDELQSLIEALPKAKQLVHPGGRIAIITFHSLEDRIVKNQFKTWAEEGFGEVITKKPLIPTEEEMETNKRSRSAKLRVFETI